MKSLPPLPPAPPGVRLVEEALFKEMKGRDEREKVVIPSTCTCTIPFNIKLLISQPKSIGKIITGKMEECAAGTVVSLGRLAEHVSDTLEGCVEELALQRGTPPGSRVLTDVQMCQWVDQVCKLKGGG